MGWISKYDVWVPHELTEKNRMDRVAAHVSLLRVLSLSSFWKEFVTGDEKWILYDNVERKKHWSKPNLPAVQHQSQTFTNKRSCSVFGGILKA